MRVSFSHGRGVAAALIFGAICSGGAYAAPDDVFLQAEPASGEFSTFRAEGSYDMVNSTVDVFNLRGSQGMPDNAGDYRGGRLMLGYKLSPTWSASAAYWRRGIDYGQDNNRIHTWMLALYYDPLAEPGARDRALFRFSAWGDYAAALQRSSSLRAGAASLTGVTIRHANDVQAQADLIVSGELSERNRLTGFFGLGISRVSMSSLNARLQMGSCQFNVDIGSNNAGTGTLLAPCRVGNTTINSASLPVNGAQFGVDVGQDFNYTSGYVNLGGSWRWKYDRFSTLLGYQFQYLIRNHIDSRVSAAGYSAIKTNHTLGLELGYAVTKNVDVFMRAQASVYNFVGTIPFLYNTAAAGRLDRAYGYASIGVRFSGF